MTNEAKYELLKNILQDESFIEYMRGVVEGIKGFRDRPDSCLFHLGESDMAYICRGDMVKTGVIPFDEIDFYLHRKSKKKTTYRSSA